MDEKKSKLYIKRLRLILIVLICVWLLMIFGFSQQDGDSSGQLSLQIAKLLFKKDDVAESMEVYVRKAAHMLEYAIGGGLFGAYFLTYTIGFWKRNIGVTFLVAGIAALDEVHQSFVPGRNGVWYDVLIDVAGCIVGLVLVHFIIMMITIIDFKAQNEEISIEEDKDMDNPYKIK